MSVVNYRTCDHCGKKLDNMLDFPEWDINLTANVLSVDLCGNCFCDLEKIVLNFVNRRAEHERSSADGDAVKL